MEQRLVLRFLMCRISTEEDKKIMSLIKIFIHENNTINPSIIFFQTEVLKHNTNMTQNYPFWFCGERKLSRYERGLGDAPGIPEVYATPSTTAGAAVPTHMHGSHVFGPLRRDNAGWSSSPPLDMLQACFSLCPGAGLRSHRADDPQSWTSCLIWNRPPERGDNRGKTRICHPLLSQRMLPLSARRQLLKSKCRIKTLKRYLISTPVSPWDFQKYCASNGTIVPVGIYLHR